MSTIGVKLMVLFIVLTQLNHGTHVEKSNQALITKLTLDRVDINISDKDIVISIPNTYSDYKTTVEVFISKGACIYDINGNIIKELNSIVFENGVAKKFKVVAENGVDNKYTITVYKTNKISYTDNIWIYDIKGDYDSIF